MKRLLFSLCLSTLVAITGCNSGTPGGPGAATPPAKNRTSAENIFRLDVPNLATHIKQGETKTIAIGVKRNKNFDEDVSLRFSELPKGVTVTPASPTISHSEEEVKITVQAAADAALGDFTVKVIGHPTKGVDATNEFKVTIEKT